MRNKGELAMYRFWKRQVQGLAKSSNRQRQRAGQEPRVVHEGRITHSMRTVRQAKAKR